MFSLLASLTLVAFSSAPLPELPSKRCVLDETGSFSPETLERLQSICISLDQTHKGQLVVAIVSDLHGRNDIGDLAIDLFRHIQLGHRDRDDGVILVLWSNPRGNTAIRITVGYGLEKGMSEDKLRCLIDEVFRSRIRNRDIDGAAIELAERLSSMVIEEDKTGQIDQHAKQRRLERERGDQRIDQPK